jgi:hypothetical protein
MGFKAFHSAQATIAGIETAHMIRKGQLFEENMPDKTTALRLLGTTSPRVRSPWLAAIVLFSPTIQFAGWLN